MSADDALRAATVDAGGAARHHRRPSARSRSGKLANLVVVTGNDLFASGTPIKHVFVEGRLY